MSETDRKPTSAERQAELAAIYCIAVADNPHHPKGRIRAATERILRTLCEAERRGREQALKQCAKAVQVRLEVVADDIPDLLRALPPK